VESIFSTSLGNYLKIAHWQNCENQCWFEVLAVKNEIGQEFVCTKQRWESLSAKDQLDSDPTLDVLYSDPDSNFCADWNYFSKLARMPTYFFANLYLNFLNIQLVCL